VGFLIVTGSISTMVTQQNINRRLFAKKPKQNLVYVC